MKSNKKKIAIQIKLLECKEIIKKKHFQFQ
jgi:hypothetical protein